MKRLFTATAILVSVAGCAGRDAQNIAVVQPQDREANCLELTAEIQANNQKLQDFVAEQNSKTTQNVAAGVAGVFIWPLWFAMDFKGAAASDAEALRSRQQFLTTLAAEKRCNSVGR